MKVVQHETLRNEYITDRLFVDDRNGLRVPSRCFAEDLRHRVDFDIGDGDDQNVGVVGHV
ncbi:MAG TPA: hypothetical protein VF713_07445 [Thermoanaerobaculia bacterium]